MKKLIIFSIIYPLLFSCQLLLLPLQMRGQNTVDNLRGHMSALTADSLLGREAGSRGEKMAAGYIAGIFEKYGILDLYPGSGQDFSFVIEGKDTLYSTNIVGIIEGYDPQLKNQYIVIGAHYDHIGYNEVETESGKQKQIYSGADNNASGVAALLEVAREINARSFQFPRSVIIAAFGAGEKLSTGSWYFLERAFTVKDSIYFMINLDMVGRSGANNSPTLYTTLPDAALTSLLRDASALPAMISPSVHSTGGMLSDHQTFTSAGIPAVLITTGNHRDSGTLRDTPGRIDYGRLEDIVMYTVELARMASGREYLLERTALSDDQQDKSGKKEGEGRGKNDSSNVYSRFEVDKPPSFLNSDEQAFLDRWVYDYVKYPKEAVRAGIQGRVVVEFIVEKDGSVSSVKVVKSLDEAIDAEAVKVIKASPKWKPGIHNGNRVRVKIALPVEFRLKK
ncbi:MAG: TonB family protein [Bacteroidales bacterium]|nr:TonB family protein [Bacteroidales bacterium]